jgi:hypothetical protein
MTINQENSFRIYVCWDCFYYHYYDELPHDSEQPKPWALWAPGDTKKYHIMGCGELGEGHFSHWPCDACGQHLAGDRYEMTGWLPQEETGEKTHQ